jgi:F0F1-type ATP synthase delta subunit
MNELFDFAYLLESNSRFRLSLFDDFENFVPLVVKDPDARDVVLNTIKSERIQDVPDALREFAIMQLNADEDIESKVVNFQSLLKYDAELKVFLQDSYFPLELKRNLLEKIVPSDYSANLKEILIDTIALKGVTKGFGMLLSTIAGMQEMQVATVETAIKPTDEQLQNISQHLVEVFERPIVTNLIVNRDLVGGYRAEVLDLVYDVSIRQKFVYLNQALKKA